MNDSTDVGTSPFDPMPDQRPDGLLFGPESISWRVHSDPLMGLAGLRAILLQVLHPVVMDAIDLHSGYSDDPWRRLHRLTEFVTLTTFGSAAEAMLHGSRVRAVHARIRGLTPEGVGYTADDPQLLAWVHCCQIASFLEIVTRGGNRLTGAEQDAYIAEQVRSAMLVGLEPDEVPHDRTGLLDYFRVIRPLLACSAGARRAATLVVRAAADPQWRLDDASTHVLPSWVPVAGLAFAALPPWARRLYALSDAPGAAALSEAATTATLRTLRASL
jgi:uncharacterized protein (DUF2236 family)